MIRCSHSAAPLFSNDKSCGRSAASGSRLFIGMRITFLNQPLWAFCTCGVQIVTHLVLAGSSAL